MPRTLAGSRRERATARARLLIRVPPGATGHIDDDRRARVDLPARAPNVRCVTRRDSHPSTTSRLLSQSRASAIATRRPGCSVARTLLETFAPFREWLPEVDRSALRADALAGMTGAIVVLPQGVAFATIAGMPPEYGLYAAMVPAVIAALYGSSRQLVSGPTTAASIVLFSSLSALALPGSPEYISYALTLTFMVGVIQLVLGFARLGTLVNFISHSVIVGFTAGAALLIAASQLRHFFGLEIERGLAFHQTIGTFLSGLDGIHPYTTFVGLATLGAGIWSRRYFPRFPYMITAMTVGAVAAAVVNEFFYVGRQAPGLGLVGAVPASLPPLSTPDLSLSMIKDLAPAAIAVTLFALTEAVSIARSLAARSGQLIDGNQEFIGQGLSNVLGSFFSSYVATGSFNRSGVNYEAGARTPLSAVFAGLLLMVLVLFVGPWLAHLPKAAMAGILFLVAWGLIDTHHIRTIARASRSDALVMWTTFFSTLFLDLDFAILLGVLLSLVTYLHRASRPLVRVRVPDPRMPRRRFTTDPTLEECPQLSLVRIDGPLFFGAVNYVAERMRVIAKRTPGQKHLLILARSINFIDVAGAEMLAREGRARRAAGGGLYFHQLPEGAREILRRGGYLGDVSEENIFETKGEAIAGIFERLDRGICVQCDRRIFLECQSVPRVELEAPETDEPDDVVLAPAPAE
ncbi:MAG: SulP family inorganic anion transporter [Ectothiorhodospiraceae bacterium]|nr:SulP family inorganic anion transporter [Chromatiales bacterium]MCP5156755.1 SulP family inorganic anion transporter [Ectothiorhodospiraceae bacterium]